MCLKIWRILAIFEKYFEQFEMKSGSHLLSVFLPWMWKCNLYLIFKSIFIPDVLGKEKTRDGEEFSNISSSRSKWVVLPRNAVKLNQKSEDQSMGWTDVRPAIDTHAPELSWGRSSVEPGNSFTFGVFSQTENFKKSDGRDDLKFYVWKRVSFSKWEK